jgi:hypothetical protein
MNPQKFVIPAQAGIQDKCKALEKLDSRFHGNDGKADGKLGSTISLN